jgi:hypothetical protein
MSEQMIREAFSGLRHSCIDAMLGTNSKTARDNFNGKTSLYQMIGLVTMLASVILGISFITTSASATLLACLPLLVGRELVHIGTNAKEVVNSLDLHGLSASFGDVYCQEEFSKTIYKGTLFMSTFADKITWLTDPLYQDYLDVILPRT